MPIFRANPLNLLFIRQLGGYRKLFSVYKVLYEHFLTQRELLTEFLLTQNRSSISWSQNGPCRMVFERAPAQRSTIWEIIGFTVQGRVLMVSSREGVVSLSLWNSVMDFLINRLRRRLTSSVNWQVWRHLMWTLMTTAMKFVEEWCNGSRLSVNTRKTGLVIFTRRRIVSDNLYLPPLSDYCSSDEVNYLGVYGV